MRQMPVCAVEMIRQVATAFATLPPTRTEHEVIDHQLTVTIEEIGQRFPAVWSIENVLLIGLNPWQLAAMPAQFVTQPCQFLLPCKQVLAGNQPLSFRYHARFIQLLGFYFHFLQAHLVSSDLVCLFTFSKT